MSSILIVDAGSTKTQWSFLEDASKNPIRIQTKGINPAHDSSDTIRALLNKVSDQLKNQHIRKIVFFGSGCGTDLLKEKIYGALLDIFHSKDIEVESDLKGAAIALFNQHEGIAAILGTGSSSALYSKGKIIHQVPSLGYILGDEGSGFALGKTLLNAVFKDLVPKEIKETFEEEYNIDLNSLIHNVYLNSKPAAYIASFSLFIKKNIANEYIVNLVEEEFDRFFVRNIFPYLKNRNYKVGFVGSIAHTFSKQLKNSASRKGIEISQIIKDPLPLLEKYYS